MADNFLERRMEDMRSGRLRESLRAKAAGTTARPGASSGNARRLSISFPDLTLLLVADSKEALETGVDTFRSAGLRTAFGSNDIKRGNALAQKSGARFYVYDEECGESEIVRITDDMRAHWGNADFIVKASGLSGDLSQLRPIFRMALMMMHPDSAPVSSLSVVTADDGKIEIVREEPGTIRICGR